MIQGVNICNRKSAISGSREAALGRVESQLFPKKLTKFSSTEKKQVEVCISQT